MVLIHTGLRIKEQHEIILDFFKIEHTEIYYPFISGSENEFRNKMFMFLSFLMVFKLIFSIYLPAAAEIILAVVFNFLIVEGLVRIIKSYSNSTIKYGMLSLIFYLSMMFVSVIMVGSLYAG